MPATAIAACASAAPVLGAELVGLTIGPRKMRGIDSEGMLCSANELGLEADWFEDGILQLEEGLEGLVHISSLVDDYYWFDEASHTLEGKRTRRRYRLGDRVHVEVARVDIPRRLLDFRLAGVAPTKRKSAEEEIRSCGETPRKNRRKKRRR